MAISKISSAGTTGFGRRNLLINGDFRVSQRGDYTSATNFVHNTYMLDRWKVATGVTSTIQDLGGYIKLLATASATSSMRIFQLIEDLYLLEGKTVVVSCEMKTNSSNGRLQIHNGSWVSTNAVHSGSGQWEKLYFTTTMPSSLSVTSIQVGIDGASSADVSISSGDYCEIKNVQLEVGTVATEFEYRSYGEELALCQRYFQYYENPPLRGVVNASGMGNRCGMVLPVMMRANPSLTLQQIGSSTHFRIYDGNASATYSSFQNSWLKRAKIEFDINVTGSSLTLGRAACLFESDVYESAFLIDAEL